jgi:hypothetical protein
MMFALRRWGGVATVMAFLSIPTMASAAACRDEADRLSARHKLETVSDSEARRDAAAPPTRERAKEHISAARKADEDGILEECLRQLAQARTLVEEQADDKR